MRTIWLIGKNEEDLITLGEIIGEGLINRGENIELIVQSEVKEILGRGLKDTQEDRSTFVDRLGFLGNLLHRNDIFSIIVSPEASLEDRKKVKEDYKNYIQVSLDTKDELTDINLDTSSDLKTNGKKIIDYLKNLNLISESEESYSEEEEEEIRKRLEDLGYV